MNGELEEPEGVLSTVLESCRVVSFPGGRLYRGDLRRSFEQGLDDLQEWFDRMPGKLLVEKLDGRAVLTYRVSTRKADSALLHSGLFLGAVLCTVLAGPFFLPLERVLEFFGGLLQWSFGSAEAIGNFWRTIMTGGVPFSFGVMVILLSHELGHYVASRSYGMDSSLPFFIPSPAWPGTFGALIKLRSPMLHKRALIDVGAAGPLTGLIVTLPVLVAGVATSHIVPIPEKGVFLGEPLLLRIVSRVIHGSIPDGFCLDASPLWLAGWLGVFVTALNLLPVGQLDGGHVLYALLGRWQRLVGWVFVLGVMAFLVTRWPGWVLWLVLILLLIKVRHPPVLDERVTLTPGRVVAGLACIGALVLCFTPVPIYVQ